MTTTTKTVDPHHVAAIVTATGISFAAAEVIAGELNDQERLRLCGKLRHVGLVASIVADVRARLPKLKTAAPVDTPPEATVPAEDEPENTEAATKDDSDTAADDKPKTKERGVS